MQKKSMHWLMAATVALTAYSLNTNHVSASETEAPPDLAAEVSPANEERNHEIISSSDGVLNEDTTSEVPVAEETAEVSDENDETNLVAEEPSNVSSTASDDALGVSGVAPYAAGDQSPEVSEQEEQEEVSSRESHMPVLTVGEDESSRYFTWYNESEVADQFTIEANTEVETQPSVEFIAAADADNSTRGSSRHLNTVNPMYRYEVKISNLLPDTSYTYQYGHPEQLATATFKTAPEGDFSFLAVGDTQLGASWDLPSDKEGWRETVDAMHEVIDDKENRPDLLVSLGDQVEVGFLEDQYAALLDETGVDDFTIAPIIGNHDGFNNTYSEHFPSPNVRVEGQTQAGADNWFTYNDVLFINLNTQNLAIDEHEEAIQAAVTENPEAKWRIVSFHKPPFTVSRHSLDPDVKLIREQLTPLMNQYDINLVLNGHDHTYTRSHEMLGNQPMVTWTTDENGETIEGEPVDHIADPEGVVYLTLTSSSGSKFYETNPYDPRLADVVPTIATLVDGTDETQGTAGRTQFAIIDVSDEALHVSVYYTDTKELVDEVTIGQNNRDKADNLRFFPLTEPAYVLEGDDFAPQAAIKNADKMPEGTTFEWVTPVVSDHVQNIPDAQIKVTFPDGSETTVSAEIDVLEQQKSQSDLATVFKDVAPLKMTVMSDTHVLSHDLIDVNSKEWQEQSDDASKLFLESEAAFKEGLRLADENGSNLLLLSGDVTKDGEHASYRFLKRTLEEWLAEDENRHVIVVPGNHDINNELFESFIDEDSTTGLDKDEDGNVLLFTPDDWMETFDNIVYSREDVDQFNQSEEFQEQLAIANRLRRAHGMEEEDYAHGYTTYAMHLDDLGVTFLGIDSAIYSIDANSTEPDTDGRGGSEYYYDKQQTGGTIMEPQMRWLLKEVDKAKEKGNIVIATQHHAVAPHYPHQEELMPDFVLTNWDIPFTSEDPRIDGKTPAEVYADNGINYLFTGHIHLNNIARQTTEDGNTVYDVQTGALVTSTIPIRHVDIYNDSTDEDNQKTALDIRTENIHALKDEYVDSEDFSKESLDRLIDERFLRKVISDTILNYTAEIPSVRDLTADLVNQTVASLPNIVRPFINLNDEVTAENVIDQIVNVFASVLSPKNLATSLVRNNVFPIAVSDDMTLDISETLDNDNGANNQFVVALHTSADDTNLLTVNIAVDDMKSVLNDLLDSVDNALHLLKDKAFVRDWAEELGRNVLDTIIPDTEFTLREAAKAVVEPFFGGDKQREVLLADGKETQVEIIDTFMDRLNDFNNYNVLNEVFKSVVPALSDLVDTMLQTIQFNLKPFTFSGAIGNIGNVVKTVMPTINADQLFSVGLAWLQDKPLQLTDVMGILTGNQSILEETLMDVLNSEQELAGDFVEVESRIYNKVVADLLKLVTTETIDGYAKYAYLFDNNTILMNAAAKAELDGKIADPSTNDDMDTTDDQTEHEPSTPSKDADEKPDKAADSESDTQEQEASDTQQEDTEAETDGDEEEVSEDKEAEDTTIPDKNSDDADDHLASTKPSASESKADDEDDRADKESQDETSNGDSSDEVPSDDKITEEDEMSSDNRGSEIFLEDKENKSSGSNPEILHVSSHPTVSASPRTDSAAQANASAHTVLAQTAPASEVRQLQSEKVVVASAVQNDMTAPRETADTHTELPQTGVATLGLRLGLLIAGMGSFAVFKKKN